MCFNVFQCKGPRLSLVFRRIVCLGSFTACCRQANVTAIPKGSLSSSLANYRPIFITSVLSKVFERLESVHLGRYIKRSGVLQKTKFVNREWLGTCEALLCLSNTLKS